jgi:hypothetical protein
MAEAEGRGHNGPQERFVHGTAVTSAVADIMKNDALSPTPPNPDPSTPEPRSPEGEPPRAPNPEPWHDPGAPVRKVNLPPDSPSPGVQVPDSPFPETPLSYPH